METQFINLNMTPSGVNPIFHISQYDVGRMLGFIVHSGGATVDLDTYTCTIEATRSDGTAITSAVATTDNIGTFEVTPTMSNKADKYRCQLIIVDENSKRIASLPFDMEVTKAAMDENSEAIEEDASLYQQYTEAVQGAIAEANADIQAEENARIAAVAAEATARANAITAEATARQTADNTLQGNINSEASTRASADSNLQSQINQIVAPSGEAPSAAEVQNARIGANGVTYDTLGDAIRGQVTDLKSDINDHSGIISANLMGIDVQENLYPGAAYWSGTWINSDPAHMGVSGVMFEGYPTVYSSRSWRRYYKEIPVVSGKTYTFEAWIKHATAGSVFLYLKEDGFTTNPATLSVNSRGFHNTPANTWTKLSVTFDCTVSGNISPYALSSTGAFYIAKYNLAEGASVFSLSESLNTKASVQSISGIGDFLRYDFSADTPPGTYWNIVIDKTISIGDKIRMIFDSYSGSSALNWVKIDGKRSDGTWNSGTGLIIFTPTYGQSVDIIAAENYTALCVQFARVTNEGNVTASVYIATDKGQGITHDILDMDTYRIFYIKKDGSGDYASFVDGINEACQYMDSIVYVGAGTYDLLSELGSDYIKNAGGQKKGVVLKNRVHVICSSQTVLQMNNAQSLYDTEQQYLNAKEYLSPINTGVYGCTLENATIIDNNARYSVHDDQGWSGDTPYTNKFINCTLIHKNGMYGDCIGGGLGENCEIEIRGCYLEGDVNIERLAYYHANNHTGITNAKGNIIVCDNYFANAGSFWLHKYGDSTEMTTALVSNNSFGSAPQVTTAEGAQDNMRMLEWNNVIRET